MSIRLLFLCPLWFLAFATAAQANSTQVALTALSPSLKPFVACLTQRLESGGAVVAAPSLKDGLEFRARLQGDGGRNRILSMVALMKADLPALQPVSDDDPEDQIEAQAHILGLLRIHVGTRAWVWDSDRSGVICRAAASWIQELRTRSVQLDHLGADGEPAGGKP